MLEESIGIHDKYQFEIKFTYPFDMSSPRTSYDVETYLFIPGNLGINRRSYTRDDFYGDLQNYIRLKTPTMLLKNVVSGENNQFDALKTSIEKLIQDPSDHRSKVDFEYRLKLFCSIAKSAFRDEEQFIESLDKNKDITVCIENYLSQTKEFTKKFRSLRSLILVPILDESIHALFFFADEYISLCLDRVRYKLLFYLNKTDIKNKEKFRSEVIKRLNDEATYRKNNNYPSITDETTDNEIFVFRRSALKKLMGSILFLNTHTNREGKYLEQIIFGIGAGIAMAFATGVAFFSRTKCGEFTLALFFVLVIAYVFKDRIKELSRSYFNNKIREWLFDYKTTIFNNAKQKLGECRESFNFVTEKKMDRKILDLRCRDYLTELDNGIVGEKIVLYKKSVKLFSKHAENSLFKDVRINGVNDIMRLNIKRFLDKMDNPLMNLFMPTKTGAVQVQGSRVYHLNMIMRYSRPKGVDKFKRFRIILTQDGIKRIEDVPVSL